MNNREIAKQFNLLANLMELHDENPFKIKSYQSAYNVLRKLEIPLAEMNHKDIEALPGVGKAIFEKIIELLSSGQLRIIKKYKDLTPSGVVELLQIRGLGPKKIRTIWHQLDITNPGELLYACNENRLVEATGFGIKSQEDVKNKVEYYLNSLGFIQLGYILDDAHSLIDSLRKFYPDDLFEWVGDLGKRMQVIEGLEILCTNNTFLGDSRLPIELNEETNLPVFKGQNLTTHITTHAEFGKECIKRTSSVDFFKTLGEKAENIVANDDRSFFKQLNYSYVSPELRGEISYAEKSKNSEDIRLIEEKDIKGIIHAHSTYSDGINDLKSMAKACIDRGFEYLVITDHSQSAGYAGGLKIDALYQQWEEIDTLNSTFNNFKILKGIESDILSNGELDYPADILAKFDVVIASIHSGMNMDELKATERLISAISNPYMHILGHPTGRLLLGRPGYPINHAKIIEACAEHQVSIELNANPQRLDLDYQWIKVAIENNVKISINPDAHSTGQIDYIKYGVIAARKGGLTAPYCLNTLPIDQFLESIRKK
ncbi:MAG TPA: PHP domain-containing protein [Saprospiraceae bacterium]|nr:PHP domain-containing protein [Saprospiraceae bacterium]